MSTKSSKHVVLITGANRGIGLAILQNLATDPRASSKPTTYLLGTRSLANGQEAIRSLRSEHPDVTADITPIELDMDSDASMISVADKIKSDYGHLDVLINNAGIAVVPPQPSSSEVLTPAFVTETREAFSRTLATNVTSVFILTTLLMPLLRVSSSGLVVMISSGRGSIDGLLSGKFPPTIVIPYSTSKTALNAVTIHLAQQPGNEGVKFELVSPGHCRTQFNGYRGTREPLEGADAVSELVWGGKVEKPGLVGFWETLGASKKLSIIPW